MLASSRRDWIIKSINTTSIIQIPKNDRITAKIILKLRHKMGHSNPYELTDEKIISDGIVPPDYSMEPELTSERITEEIVHLKKKRQIAEQKEIDEQLELERLLNQEQQQLIDIQTDIEIKFKNNELSMTDEQRQKLAMKKRSAVPIDNPTSSSVMIPEKPYLPLKIHWDNFIEWKKEHHKDKTGKNYSANSLDNLRMSFTYLLEFIDRDENYNIHDFTSLFFKELQHKFKKIPSGFNKIKECEGKSLPEIIALNLPEEKYPRLTNNYINVFFNNYRSFFFYLKHIEIYKNDIFDTFLLLPKTKSDGYSEFSYEDLKILFHNDVERGNKEIILDILKIGLYSGMRLNEISQLKKENIVEIDGVMCFELVEDVKAGKTLKTKSSKRIIPIHSQLTDIVDKYLTTSKNDFLVWSGSSNRNSDRIGEYIRLFIKDDTKVFHSTRKNFAMELYKHPENELVIKYLIGHSDLKRDITFGIYNKNKMDVQLTKKVIELVKYDL